MTLSTTTSRVVYNGDGSNATFSFPYYFQFSSDLKVYVQAADGTQSLKVLNTDYSASGAASTSGGSITFLITTPPTGSRVVIFRDPPVTQLTSLSNNDPMPAKSLEKAFDKEIMVDQRTREMVARAPRLVESDIDGSGRYDFNGNRAINVGAPVDATDVATKAYADSVQATAQLGQLVDGVVTNAKLANVTQGTIKGRHSGASSPGAVEDLTAAQATAIINTVVADTRTVVGTKGLAPAPAAGDADRNRVLGPSGWIDRQPLYQFVTPSDFAAKTLPNRADIVPRAINGSGLGSVTMTRTPSDVWRSIVRQNALADTYAYVDPVNGSDAAAGTQAAPYLTLSYAMNTATALNIVGIPTGPFLPCSFDGATAVKPYKRLSFLGPATIRTNGATFPEASSLTWTVTSGAVYQTSLAAMTGSSAPQRFMYLDRFDSSGLNTRFAKYANLAALQAASNANPSNINGWAYDPATKVIYVAFFNLSVETYKAKFGILYLAANGDSGLFLLGSVTLFIDSPYAVTFEGCSIQGYNSATSTPTTLVEGRGLVNIFAAPGNGVHTSGGFHYFSGVRVEAPDSDCFNHDPSSDGVESMVIIHNCQGNYGGDTATFGTAIAMNRNGRSLHGGVNGICAGNSFGNNWGPNIADTTTPGITSLTWSVGEETIQSADGADAGMGYYGTAAAPTSLRKVWVDTGVTKEEVVSLYAVETTITTKVTNCSLNVPRTSGNGAVFVDYVRNAP